MTAINNHTKERQFPDSEKTKLAREELSDANMIDSMAQFFGMLSDPTRLKIVLVLKKGELCVQEIAEAIDLSISAVSHQLRLLKTAKMVKNRRNGKMVYYSLDDEHIEQLIAVADAHVNE